MSESSNKLISTSTTNSSSIVLELEEVVEEDESEEVTDTVSEVKSEQLDIVVAAFIFDLIEVPVMQQFVNIIINVVEG